MLLVSGGYILHPSFWNDYQHCPDQYGAREKKTRCVGEG